MESTQCNQMHYIETRTNVCGESMEKRRLVDTLEYMPGLRPGGLL